MKKTNAKAAAAVIVVPENAALESSEKMPPSDVACKCELTIYAKVVSPDDEVIDNEEKIAKKLMDDWTRVCTMRFVVADVEGGWSSSRRRNGRSDESASRFRTGMMR